MAGDEERAQRAMVEIADELRFSVGGLYMTEHDLSATVARLRAFAEKLELKPPSASRAEISIRLCLCVATLNVHYQKYSAVTPYAEPPPRVRRQCLEVAMEEVARGIALEAQVGPEGKRLGLGLQLHFVRSDAYWYQGRLLAARADIRIAAAYKGVGEGPAQFFQQLLLPLRRRCSLHPLHP